MTDHDFQEMLSDFKRSSEQDLCAFLEAENNRFPSNRTLLSRYRKAYDICFDRGYSDLDQFMEAHNELCAAVALLQPALTIGIGLIVSFVVLALVSAMYSIYGQLNA